MRSSAQLDRDIATMIAKTKPEIIARRTTFDGKAISLWNDGSLTWGRWNVIKGSPRAQTAAQIEEALRAGWLVLGEVEIHDADDVPRLIGAARKVARRGGLPGDVRREFWKDAPLKPQWQVQEADRDGRPTVRVWRLPRMTHPGMVIWDEVRGSHGSRYRVMTEIMERGRRSGTLADTGVRFKDLASLGKYLRETSEIRR